MGEHLSRCPSRLYSWLTVFLIFINNLPLNVESVVKIFADDVSLFSSVNNQQSFADKLNRDLERITAWEYQWNMLYNPDPGKQVIAVNFSRKSHSGNIPVIYFNNIPVAYRDWQKHLGVILYKKLAFEIKANKCIGLTA